MSFDVVTQFGVQRKFSCCYQLSEKSMAGPKLDILACQTPEERLRLGLSPTLR